jgi:hypothetical protein
MMALSASNGARIRATLGRLGLVALASWLCVALLDLLLVRGPKPVAGLLERDPAWLVLWLGVTAAAGAGFFVVLLHHFGDQTGPNTVKPAVISLALAAIWLFVAFTLVINFHLLIGGRL